MPLFFFCDDATGDIVTGGMTSSFDEARANTPPEGQSLFVVPNGTVSWPRAEGPDFTVLKEHLRRQIDLAVGQVRSLYVTDVPGQAQTYEKKEAEARAWTEGDELLHPERYPFMVTEAQVRSMSIADVQAEIMEQVNQLTPLASFIEAHRVHAKQAVLSASTLPQITAAANVDWQALMAAAVAAAQSS